MAEHFPRERIKQMAVASSAGPGRIHGVGRGLPLVGIMQEHAHWCVLEDGFVFDPFDVRGSEPVDGRLDVARRMRSLMDLMRFVGIDEITHGDIAAECSDVWSSDYAIVCDAFSPWGEGVESDYFDRDLCRADFREAVRRHFAGDPTVVVTFHNTNEIEVTRP